MFGYQLSDKMVNYFEAFAVEEKSFGDVLEKAPVAAVGIFISLYLCLMISTYYINSSEPQKLVK